MAEAAAALAVAVGCLGFIGWGSGERHFTRIALAFRPIVPHTSLGLVTEGVALLLLVRAREHRWARLAGRALASAAVLVGALEVYEWLGRRTVLLDRALSAPAPTLLAAVGVVLVGAGLLSLDGRTRRGHSPAQYVALASMFAALVVTVGYVFQEPVLYDLPVESFPALGMSLPSAVGLTLLSVGLLCARPMTGVMKPVTSTGLGGSVARRFLAAVLLAPALGLVAMAGEQAGLWEQEVAEAVLAVIAMVIGTSLVLTTARSLNGLDADRRRALDEVLRWKEFFDRAAWGAVLVNADATIAKANAAYAKMHGYAPGELEGMPVACLMAESQRARAHELFAATRELGHLRFESERERKDGTHFHAVVDVTALKQADGTVSHYASYLQDVSDQKAAEQARARLAAIVESSDDAIHSSDMNGVLLTVNAAAERLFGYSAEELVGHSASVFVPPERGGELARLLALLRRGEHVVGFETVRVRKDGTRFPVSLTIFPVRDRDGRATVVSAVVRDISKLKELERQREEWGSLVAHDLRQPLQMIALHAQMAATRLDRAEPSSLARAKESLQRILTATQRLDRMVGDLTDVSRIEASHLELELREIDLGRVVGDLIARMAPLAADRPLRLEERGAPRRITADAARIEQVVGNVLSNALKYGEPRTEIAVAIEWKKDEVEIAVTNRGPGISSEDLGCVFERFERTRAAHASATPGLGVGLYICRGLVEAHHGRIWVESTPGATTTFHVALPAPGDAPALAPRSVSPVH